MLESVARVHYCTHSFFSCGNSVDGIESVCESGVCRAEDVDADVDLCRYFNYPCGEGGRNGGSVAPHPRGEAMSRMDEVMM